MLVYGNDRYSQDLDFDCLITPCVFDLEKERLERNILSGCPGVREVKTVKDTDTVKRLKVFYDDSSTGLKIEFSFRLLKDKEEDLKSISEKIVRITEHFGIYTIDALAQQKINAFLARARARDIYDIGFILECWLEDLKEETRTRLLNELFSDGIENLMELTEKEFLTDPRLGTDKFYKTYGRLLGGITKLKTAGLNNPGV